MAKFENFIKQLEKKGKFKLPKPTIENEDFAEIKAEYDDYVKQGYLKSPNTVTEFNITYLVYKATKKAEKYFKNKKKKLDKNKDV